MFKSLLCKRHFILYCIQDVLLAINLSKKTRTRQFLWRKFLAQMCMKAPFSAMYQLTMKFLWSSVFDFLNIWITLPFIRACFHTRKNKMLSKYLPNLYFGCIEVEAFSIEQLNNGLLLKFIARSGYLMLVLVFLAIGCSSATVLIFI